MERVSSWFKVILTWVVLIPNLALSYIYLRNQYIVLEYASLALNFLTTTVLFYVYMDIHRGADDGESSATTESNTPLLYNMTFGSLIEDMGVWLALFFLLYNIVPVTLYLHNLIAANI